MHFKLLPPAPLALTSFSLIGTFKSASTMMNKSGATTTSSITLFLFCTHSNVLHSLNPMLDQANLPTTSKLTTFPTHPIQDHCFLNGPLPVLFSKASQPATTIYTTANPFKQPPIPSTAKSTNTRTFSNFNPLAPSSSNSLSNLTVVPTLKFATFFYSLPNALPNSHFSLHALKQNASFVAYHAQALSVLTHVGTAHSILDPSKKTNTTFQLAAGTFLNTAIPF